MKDHDLYKRFLDTYDLLCDDIDRLDVEDGANKEIVLGDLGCDLAYLRRLIDEVYGGEEPVNNLSARKLAEIKKKEKHYNDFGEYLKDHPELEEMAEKYPTMFSEKVCEVKYTWKERIMFWVILLFGCIGGGFAGHVFGNFIKGLLGL